MDNSALLKQRALALIGLGLIVTAAVVTDRLTFAMARSAALNFIYVPAVMVGGLANLALALAVLTLAAWIGTRAERDPLVAALYLGVGLLIVVFPVLGVAFGVPGAMADVLGPLMPNTRVAYTAGLLAAAGLMNATRPRRPARGAWSA
jgi:hypothetical protein